MWLPRFFIMMKVFGLTGGIATGKSTAVSIFQKLDPGVAVFCADDAVAQLYASQEVLETLVEIVGDASIVENGDLNRDRLRQRFFANDTLRERIQHYIHPLVRKECLEYLECERKKGVTSSFIADVPLLFEGGFDCGQSANLVVAVSRETQVQRLIMRSGFDEATVQAILEAQLPISQKEKCADVVFWNEGSVCVLEAQIRKFIENKYQ